MKRLINKIVSIFGLKFIKFALVGFGGMVTNLTLFFIFADIFHLWENFVAVMVFFIAGTQNYMLHHIWTFKQETTGKKFSLLSWIKFNIASSVGLGINLIVMNLILYFFDLPLKVIAQGCGVFTGTVFNYLGSKYFVFTKKKLKEEETENI